MTAYQVLIAEELLSQVRRDSSGLPAGFRIGEVIGPEGYRRYRVEVEDDRAPAELEGCLVEPTFQQRFGALAGDSRWSETLIIDRFVVERREVAELRADQLRAYVREQR